MDDEEIRRSAALEQRHWWYAGRRALIRKLLRGVPTGQALDVGTGSGGNTQTVAELGWQVTGLEYSTTAARLAAARGLPMVQGDATALPFADECFDLVMSTDVWEHIEDDRQVASEAFRVCRRGGRALIAVPTSMALWSGHDVALGHVRRYERPELIALIESVGFRIHDVRSWNVLLRPVAMARRRTHQANESEMQPVHPVLNTGLRTVVAIESLLPVQSLPGISLVVRAVRD